MLRNIIKSFSKHHVISTHTMAVPISVTGSTPAKSAAKSNKTASYATSTYDHETLAEQLDCSSNPAALLEATISAPDYRIEAIELGQKFDPYRADARVLATTRQLLEILFRYQHPVTISTKSHLIIKDIDLLTEMATVNLCRVTMGLNTLDESLKANMEPRTASAQARLNAMKKLSQAGIPVNIMVSPVIPLVNDNELEQILTAAKLAGVNHAGYELLRLSNNVKPLFREWLRHHYPKNAKRIINLVHSSFNGKDERSEFSKSMSGSGVFAAMLEQRFNHACKQLSLQVIV